MRRFASPAIVLASLWSGGCSPTAGAGPEPDLDAGLGDGKSADTATPGPDATAADGAKSDGSAWDSSPDAGADPADVRLADDAQVGPLDAIDGTSEAGPDGAATEAGVTPCSTPCVHGACLASSGCACDLGWAGSLCDVAAPALVPGTSMTGNVTAGQWAYFSYRGRVSGLSATLSEDTTVGLVWAYLAASRTPTQSSNLSADENASSANHSVTYTFASPGTQTWYVAAYGQPAIPSPTQVVTFHLQITAIP